MTIRETIQQVKEYDEVRLSGRCTSSDFEAVNYQGTVSSVAPPDEVVPTWAIKVWPNDECLHAKSNGRDWFDEDSLTELVILSRDEDIWGPGSNKPFDGAQR